MASGFFALFDDIAVLMDDVATMSKVATKKTSGLLADDLAVNAEKASGFVSSRELPVLWKISKGSLLNKAIILPVTFLLSAFLPWAILSILMIGGVYLAFEGVEKIYEYFFHKGIKKEGSNVAKMTAEEAAAHEKAKIKSAILVDFILSAEIVIIALGSVTQQPLEIQIAVVTIVALLATVGVYGLVALLVRMDDFGYRLIALGGEKSRMLRLFGQGLVKSLPLIVRSLAVIGTLAMILVGGGIFVHNWHFLHDLLHDLPAILGELLTGLTVGIIALLIYKLTKLILKK